MLYAKGSDCIHICIISLLSRETLQMFYSTPNFVLCTLSDLLNTGETSGRKVHPPTSFETESPLQLLRPSFANRNLIAQYCKKLQTLPSFEV